MTKVQSKNAILFDIENDAGPLRDAMVATIGEGTALDPGLISAIDKAKLDGIAAGATANATDAALRDRATHTGEQAIGTITGLVDALAGKATPADVAAALAGLVDSSPATLDTLNELAAALGDDPAFATTVSTALGNRLRVDAAQGLTAPQQAQGRDNLGLGSAALAASGDFATAAQGALADTALQSSDIAAAVPAIIADTMLVDNAEGTERETKTFEQVKTLLNLTNVTRAFATSAALLLATVAEDNIIVADVPMVADAAGTFLDRAGKKFKPAFWVTPKLFGAAGDGSTDDRTAVQAAWTFSGDYKIPCDMQGLEYNASESLYLRSNMRVYGRGCVLYITAWPAVGAFVHNVWPVESDRIVTDIVFEDVIMDGSKLSAPSSSQNSNLFDIARGGSNITVRNCVGRYMRVGGGDGTGGGAFGVELGGNDILYENCRAQDCFRGFRVKGMAGEWIPGAPKAAVGVTIRDCIAERCWTAIFGHTVGATGAETLASDLSYMDWIVSGMYIVDCGHAAWSPLDYTANPTVPPRKGSVIAIAAGHNCIIENCRVRLSPTLTTTDEDWLGNAGYPATGDYSGAGLSGPVGALIRFRGNNIRIRNIILDGEVDSLLNIGRSFAYGDLGTVPSTTNGSVRQVLIEDVALVDGGSVDYVLDAEPSLDSGQVAVNIKGVTLFTAPSVGIVSSDAALSTITLEVPRLQGGTAVGTAAQWYAGSNVLPNTGVHTFLGAVNFGHLSGYSATGVRKAITVGTDLTIRWSTTGTSSATIANFYNANGIGGNINLNGETTNYATTSDEGLKDFIGEYDWKEAFRIIKADPVRQWKWKTSGGYAVGWGAQTSYSISPDLAVPGGWFGSDGLPCEEGTEGSVYMPWGIDQGKRTPYLWAAVSHLIDELDALKAELTSRG